jgi:hypothetical protein
MRMLCVAVWLAGCIALPGAELSLSRLNVNPGGTAAVELRYASQGSQVSALQVDLHFDAANLTVSATAGSAATASGKALGSAELVPGTMRILLMGFTPSVLQDGVVAVLLVSASSTAHGSYSLQLSNALAADSAGGPLGLATIDGVVSVESGAVLPAAGAFGQIVSGGPWKTTFTLINTSSAPATARLNFWDDAGQPLVLPLSLPGGVPASSAASFECSLGPGAMCVIETVAPDATDLLVGWAELQSADGVTGFAVLRDRLAPDRDSEAMLMFDPREGPDFVLPYDDSEAFETGVAIANRSAGSPADLMLILRDESGATILEDPVTLPARGHISFVAGARYPVLSGLRGTIEVQSRSGSAISVLGLRFNPTGSFTSVPVVAK